MDSDNRVLSYREWLLWSCGALFVAGFLCLPVALVWIAHDIALKMLVASLFSMVYSFLVAFCYGIVVRKAAEAKSNA